MPNTESVYLVGDTYTYECNDGFVYHGDLSVTCNSGGEWSTAAPDCVGKIHICYLLNGHIEHSGRITKKGDQRLIWGLLLALPPGDSVGVVFKYTCT